MNELDPNEFEVGNNASLVRCRLCPGAKWMTLGNARRHASEAKKHRERAGKRDCVRTTTTNKIHGNPISERGSLHSHDTTLSFDSNIDEFNQLQHISGQFDEPQFFNSSTMDEDFTMGLQAADYVEGLGLFESSAMDEELPLEDVPDNWIPDESEEENDGFESTLQDASDAPPLNEPKKNLSKFLDQGEWAPYPSKAMFLTDLLFTSPRLRFSEAQKKAILRWGKDLGARDVPTLTALQKVQGALRTVVGDPTTEKHAPKGNIFYINEVNSAIAKDLANPLVRPHLNFYPERCEGGKMTQTWHGAKWLSELPDDMLTPMAIHPNGQHFYVGELCERRDGSLFIPQKWFLKEGNNLWATGVDVKRTPAGLSTDIQCTNEYALEDLWLNYIRLKEQQGIKFADESTSFAEKMPNPKRAVAAGRPYYTIPAMIFIDDVSGNVSKQWNKHYVCYMSNACLPREQLNEEFNIHFVGSSPHLTALELAQGICESFQATTEGKLGFDCLLKTECIFRVIPYIKAADNPMQAELCSQCGLTANKFCRTCDIGGSQMHKRSDEGYLQLFECGKLRTPEETKDAIHTQFTRALQPKSQTAIENMVKETGVKDTIAQPYIEDFINAANELALKRISKPQIHAILEKKYNDLKEAGNIQNPFLEMPGSNIHLDCPTEILHTILLGAVKYFWGQAVYLIIAKKKLHDFQARLESITTDGLNIPRIKASYMCQYRGSLIGKHFKTIAQVLPMVIYDLVHTDLLDTFLLLGRLTVLCWHTRIDNIDDYINELEFVIDQFLTKAAHLPMYIRRFGPALLFSTERYESFNSVFRLSQIHSNRMAPSRDAAISFSELDRVQHIVSGGYWYNVSTKQYLQASQNIQEIVTSTSEYANLIGFPKIDKCEPGSFTFIPLSKEEKKKKTRKAVAWTDLPIASINEYHHLFNQETLFYRAQSIITQNKDIARLGSTVVVRDSKDYILGRLKEILITDGSKPHIFLQLFKLKTTRHPKLDLPMLILTETYKQVGPENLVCTVNVQHDCPSSGCEATATVPILQERQQTMRRKTVVAHKDDLHFILNTLSLHNYEILKEILPPALRTARIYYNDVEQKAVRLKMAVQVRDKKSQQNEAKEAMKREAVLGHSKGDAQLTITIDSPMDSNGNGEPEANVTPLTSGFPLLHDSSNLPSMISQEMGQSAAAPASSNVTTSTNNMKRKRSTQNNTSLVKRRR